MPGLAVQTDLPDSVYLRDGYRYVRTLVRSYVSKKLSLFAELLSRQTDRQTAHVCTYRSNTYIIGQEWRAIFCCLHKNLFFVLSLLLPLPILLNHLSLSPSLATKKPGQYISQSSLNLFRHVYEMVFFLVYAYSCGQITDHEFAAVSKFTRAEIWTRGPLHKKDSLCVAVEKWK